MERIGKEVMFIGEGILCSNEERKLDSLVMANIALVFNEFPFCGFDKWL